MTINVAVATFDAVVLGCDSLSSIVQPMLNLVTGAQFVLDDDGKPVSDKHGRSVFTFDESAVEQQPTTVFGGVSKMFLLYQNKDTSVAAVTSGQGTISGRTIATLATSYRRSHEVQKTHFTKVEDVADDFLQYMHGEWCKQPHLSSIPEEIRQYMPSVNFILGGYGADDDYGKIFHLDVARVQKTETFPKDHHCGVTWGGQAGFVQRLLRGVDASLEQLVQRRIVEALDAQRTQLLEAVLSGLTKAGVPIPEGINFDITEVLAPSDPWDKFWATVDYPNLPVQYAVDLASLLVNTQSGMQHFGSGIATVGGRTHIGVLQRNTPFKKLKEPKLAHAHTGYSHEL